MPAFCATAVAPAAPSRPVLLSASISAHTFRGRPVLRPRPGLRTLGPATHAGVSFSIRASSSSSEEPSALPGLPPAQPLQYHESEHINTAPKKTPIAFVGTQKVKLMFTCKICDTRSSKMVNRLSLQQGICIIKCDGCDKRHIMADNLGWYGDRRSFEQTGHEAGGVSRVNEEVYRLEELLMLEAAALRDSSIEGANFPEADE
eukprot:tig00021127_g18861.t1